LLFLFSLIPRLFLSICPYTVQIKYATKTGEEPVNKAISACIYNLEAIESRYGSSIRVNPEAYRIGSYII